MAGIKWPGEQASELDHLRYFTQTMNHVASSPPPPGYSYVQMPHGEGTTIGDPSKPAMLNASYKHFGRSLVSFSIPDFIKLEEGFHFHQGSDGQVADIKRGMGLTTFNLSDSLTAIMDANGVRTDEPKIGHDRMSRTIYVEMDVRGEDYDRAKTIMNTIVQGRDKSPSQLLSQIKDLDAPRLKGKGATPPSFDVIPTNKGPYISVEGMKPGQVDVLKDSLKRQGIDFTERRTSLNGGMNVLAVASEDAAKLETFRDSLPQTAKRTPHMPSRIGGGTAAGVALAGFSGIAAAAEPGATTKTVATVLADTMIPGWMQARKGDACGAFGEAAGTLASGAVVVAGAPVVAGAAIASGPAAPLVGTAGTAGLVGATVVTHDQVSKGAENLCRIGAKAYDFLKNQF